MIRLKDMNMTLPPLFPSEGSCYHIGKDARGDFSRFEENDIVVYRDWWQKLDFKCGETIQYDKRYFVKTLLNHWIEISNIIWKE